MNICLVMPKSTFLIDPMVYPPLGLWYLAAQLEAQHHTVDFRDLSVDETPLDGEYDQIWVSATAAQMHEVKKLGSLYKRTATVIGGPGPWGRMGKGYENLGFDLMVVGEADHPERIQRIVDSARNHEPKILRYGPTRDLSHVLPPVRRWAHKYKAELDGHRTTTYFTSRGCPMACAFCESGRNGTIWDGKVRYEPFELVRAQLVESLELGFTGAMFYDDIFPINKPRTLDICGTLKSLGIVWRCFLRTDVIIKQGGYEYLKIMRDAGLTEVLAGVESADNRIKENIHKGTTIEQDTLVLHWCKDLGIKFKASLILGLPGETRKSMEATKKWILRERPDRADVNILVPLPGTPLTERPEDFDCSWSAQLPDEFWFKGVRADIPSLVSTSALTPDDISAFHRELIEELEAEHVPY